MSVAACSLPPAALLAVYQGQEGAYTDCFSVQHTGEADLSAFIGAFYTTWLFRLERAVLTVALRKRIRDSDVVALAEGHATEFAVWTVESRAERQILLRDMFGKTRSFLSVAPVGDGSTELLFGSAVVSGGGSGSSLFMRLTTPLHQIYAKALLRQAERRLRRG
ncbi:hypothetical protein HKX54_05330 [Sulfitobacter sp. M57]|uniref:hypothetical protein n=1 Tax=unclassified Sulfitobacter TaxID=196795 RepID=UPI0023E15E51|nr:MULTISPECIES: hypothetical protein [unclassified Sulfitobacter]MDF3413869.1 hypothetical protein [Sulfitobacter sp. KE5]MDF3420850.1 hypothetical protein [Sulfitobacter sp. KE43]MDF3432415.1 hypothetical protein [Sulfitobacter sp. KE42]MDF3458054.1 hypothetical protein [Sulfitobacter sp. S74]MDF3461955.1 hypothetical protein [Sulfitobacter sp. Ks18]